MFLWQEMSPEEKKDSEVPSLDDHFATSGNLMDSRTSHLDDLLLSKLESAFHQQTQQFSRHELARIASEHSAIDLAHAVSRIPAADRPTVFDSLPSIEGKIDFITNTDSNTRSTLFWHMSQAELSTLFNEMPINDIAWVVEDMSDRKLWRLLDLLPAPRTLAIKELLQHDRNSAGRLMTDAFFAFSPEMTMKQVAESVRDHPGTALGRRLFVVSEKQELLGYVPVRNLVVNPPELTLKRVMLPVEHTVDVSATREEVVDIVERYKIDALPVLDDKVLVGVITHEEVVEALEDIADDTIARMAGTLETDSVFDPLLKRFFARAPWLLVTLAAGLINASNLDYFSSALGPFYPMVFFVPLIAGMSGNIGLQCSTVLVRGMATGMLSSGSRSEVVFREIRTGLLTGLVFGLICGSAVFFIHSISQIAGDPPAWTMGLLVSSGLFAACMGATLMGVFAPLLFARLKIDPAIASGPIVTAFNDVLSALMYFAVVHFLKELIL